MAPFFIQDLVPLAMMQQDASTTALVVSVWTAPIEDVERGIRPSEHSERGEAITVMVADAEGHRCRLPLTQSGMPIAAGTPAQCSPEDCRPARATRFALREPHHHEASH